MTIPQLDAEYFQSVCDSAGIYNEAVPDVDWLRVRIPHKTDDMTGLFNELFWKKNVFRHENGIPFNMLLEHETFAPCLRQDAMMPEFDDPVRMWNQTATLRIDWPGYEPRTKEIAAKTFGELAVEVAREYMIWVRMAPLFGYGHKDKFWRIKEECEPTQRYDLLKTKEHMRLVALHLNSESHELRAEVHLVVGDPNYILGEGCPGIEELWK